jgi:hypothetical protein
LVLPRWQPPLANLLGIKPDQTHNGLITAQQCGQGVDALNPHQGLEPVKHDMLDEGHHHPGPCGAAHLLQQGHHVKCLPEAAPERHHDDRTLTNLRNGEQRMPAWIRFELSTSHIAGPAVMTFS